jgi:hypothetical protein
MDDNEDIIDAGTTIDYSSILNSSLTGAIGSYSTTSPNYGNVTISTAGSNAFFSTTNGSSWSTSANPSSLQVTGNAEFEGDVKIKGVSITDAIDKINKRLAILVPDPAKLEHFEALKRAYENYKTLEALCELPEEDE